jgi:hypothetical protein
LALEERTTMSTPYFAILDNSVVDEPLAPGIPYWFFPVEALPTLETADRFVEDILVQSELWANAGGGEEWVTLRLVACRHMCPRCGHIVVSMAGSAVGTFHGVWFVAHNPHWQVMGHESFLHAGLWFDDYLSHCCPTDFFAT